MPSQKSLVVVLLVLVGASVHVHATWEGLEVLPPVDDHQEIGEGGDVLYEADLTQEGYKTTQLVRDDAFINKIAEQEAALAVHNSKTAKQARATQRKARVGLVAEGLEARKQLIKMAYDETEVTPVPPPTDIQKLKAVRAGQYPATKKSKDARVNVEPGNKYLINGRDNTHAKAWVPPAKGSKAKPDIRDALYVADVSRTNPYDNPYLAPGGPETGPNRHIGAFIPPQEAQATPTPKGRIPQDRDPDNLKGGLPAPKVPRTGGRMGIDRATGRKIRPNVFAPDYKLRKKVFRS